MLEQVKRAQMSELNAVCDFYQAVCQQQTNAEYAPGWYWGVYPSESQLKAAILKRQLVIGTVNGQVVAAGRLTVGEDAAYRDVNWQFSARENEIGVLHLYAVHPDFRGHGLASEMLRGILTEARDAGQRVVHLDVRKGNVPAEKLYVSNGFNFVAEKILPYDNLGDTWARLGECQVG